jgi:multidrug efflux pump subunit AcrA (membrane-fusion protein)
VQHHGPWSGRTAKVHVRSHMSVTAGQPLVDLVKAGPLKLRLNAPSRWLGQLKTGLAFEVAIEETGKRYPAKVSAVNSRVDSVSQTVELEATLAGSYPELLPGMSGTAVFPPR